MGCTMSGAFVFIMTSYGTKHSELCALKGGASRHTLRLILHRNNVQVSRNNVRAIRQNLTESKCEVFGKASYVG